MRSMIGGVVTEDQREVGSPHYKAILPPVEETDKESWDTLWVALGCFAVAAACGLLLVVIR